MTNKTNILVIEDNQEHIELIKALNKEFNYHIDIGMNISDFNKLILTKTYHLILCDLHLQYQLEGLDILKSFKRYNLDSKIYAYENLKRFYLNHSNDLKLLNNH